MSTGATAKPACTRDDALAVLRTLRDAGHLAYFAGGCVRDQLLGLTPADHDIATDATPSRIRDLFPRSQAVGAAFGVILVRHRASQVEVATFRADSHYSDGRRPDAVRFTTPAEDARRRDFTINGLFQDPIGDEIIDHVGGRADLAERRLRAIGEPDARFAEDHLRLLRAVRFAARFDFHIEPATAAAIRRHAPSLIRISPERIADELRRMLTAPTRTAAWRLLWDHGLMDPLTRYLGGATTVGVGASIFDTLSPGRIISFPLALAGFFVAFRQVSRDGDPAAALESGDVAPSVRALRTTLRLSNDDTDRLQDILRSCGELLSGEIPTLPTTKRFLAAPAAAETRQLLSAFAAAGHRSDRIAALEESFDALAGVECAPAPLLTGDDLAAAGLRPGPRFKRLLDATYDAQLENRLTDRASALAWALEQAREHDPGRA